MSKCKFEDKSTGGGMTLMSAPGSCSKDTGVFLPKPHYPGQKFDVLLWFHGFYVYSATTLFSSDGTKVRDIVRSSGKDLVVIAPHMGFVEPKTFKGKAGFNANNINMGAGNACERYLDEVLDALAPALPEKPRSQKSVEDDTDSAGVDIDNLYIGCHSGGGTAMKLIVGGNSLGRYKSKLKQCWGFDCVYGLDGWEAAVRNRSDVDFYLYFGQGTSFDDGGTPVQLWNIVYGKKKASNVYMAPCFPGVDDDKLAFQSVDDIKNKTSNLQYDLIRKDTDPNLYDSKTYWAYVRKKYWPQLKSHYAVSADLLGPRISRALP